MLKLTQLTEPLWYVIRMPGGVGGGHREVSPYHDYLPKVDMVPLCGTIKQ